MSEPSFHPRSWCSIAFFSTLLLLAIIAQLATTTLAQASPNSTVAEEVPGWIRVYSNGTVERLTPPGGEAITAIVPPYTKPRGGVTIHDITTDRGFDVRLYLPEPAAAAGSRQRPVLVHFHGGGFCVSLPSWALYHNFYAPLTAKLKVAGIVSVYLPLAPEHRLPAAIDAGHDALLWLRDVACGKNVSSAPVERLRKATDFSRVFLIGDSSGGNLVHLVAARVGEHGMGLLHPVRLAGGVLLHPGFARVKRSRSELENPPNPLLTLEMIDKLLALGLPLGVTKDSPYTSPELAAKAVEHVAMPPLLVMVAEKDLLRDPQLDYGKAMVMAGKEVETKISKGAVAHVFFLNFLAVKSDRLTSRRTKELIHAIKHFINHH